MSTLTRTRFAELVRQHPVDLATACLLVDCEVDPDIDVGAALAELDRRAAAVPASGSDAQRLRAVLGDLRGDDTDYARLDSSLLSEVLRRRRGLPILLSVVWIEVARRAGIPAYGTTLPGHFVVGVGDPDAHHVLVDPFRGGCFVPEPGPLPAWTELGMLQRLLTNIRRWADQRPERMRTRVWATELGLLVPGHPVELRRDLGHCLVRLGHHREAATTLLAYAAAVEADAPDLAERARQESRMALSQMN